MFLYSNTNFRHYDLGENSVSTKDSEWTLSNHLNQSTEPFFTLMYRFTSGIELGINPMICSRSFIFNIQILYLRSIYFSQSLICNRVFFWSKWFDFVGGAKLLWIYSLSKVCQIGPQIGYSISNYWTSTRGGSFTSPLTVEMMTHLAPLKSEVCVGGGWEDYYTMCKTNQQMKDSVVNVVLNTCSLLPVWYSTFASTVQPKMSTFSTALHFY